MASYFSNHSQSRFLANSTTAAPAHAATPASNTLSSGPRTRLPSSKHFSTSVSHTSSIERSLSKELSPRAGSPPTNGAASVHPLRNTYVRTLSRVSSSFGLDLLSLDGYFGSANSAPQVIKSQVMKKASRRSLPSAPSVLIRLRINQVSYSHPKIF